MKKRWKILGATLASLVVGSMVMNYHATHSGPFNYFRNKYPELSAKEIAEQGSKDINQFFAISKTGNEAELFMSKLGLVCSIQDKKNSPNMVKFYSTKKDLAKIVRCKHSFGLVFGQNIWAVEYFLNSEDSVIDGGSLIICPACQGV